MAIEPDIIPFKSKEGNSAIPINNPYLFYLLIIIVFFLISFVLKILIESILIILGIVFLLRLALS
tara:strand:+ start:7477 stop:7671 length:195 start_codon:yes stop_codon:yes gene_type:complete